MNERFTTLDQVVKDICEIGGDDYDHKSYGKVLKVCVNTLRGFNLYSSTPYVKTEEFEVLPNNTVLLPRNALDVVRVGKNDRCGEIEEIFYSKDLSMDAKNIEEHCECSGKVQVIETIETGTGETLCDYRVEGIDLGEEVCEYSYEPINGVENPIFVCNILDDQFTIKGNSNFDTVAKIRILKNVTEILYNERIRDVQDLEIVTKTELLEMISDSILTDVSGDIEFIPTSDGFKIVSNGISENSITVELYVGSGNILGYPINLYSGIEYSTSGNFNSNGAQTSTGIRNATLRLNNTYTFEVLINDSWSDQTSYVNNGKWILQDGNSTATVWIIKDSNGNEITSGDVTVECEGEGNAKTFEVNINGEWEDETDNVSENGTWSLSNTTDIVTEWRYRDSEGEPSEPIEIEGVCRVDLQRQEVSKWVDSKVECDNKGRCKSCGNFVPTYTTAWYGGWYSSAPIYSRQLAQNNLNLPNSGQAYYEQYTARPYPAKWGFYNLDLAKGVMRLTHNFEHGEKVVIIYSTDMVEIEGAKVVAVEWFDMLLYRCKELIWNRNSVDGTRQRQLYEREYTRIKKIYNKTTHEEWRRAIMKVKYSGVKR